MCVSIFLAFFLLLLFLFFYVLKHCTKNGEPPFLHSRVFSYTTHETPLICPFFLSLSPGFSLSSASPGMDLFVAAKAQFSLNAASLSSTSSFWVYWKVVHERRGQFSRDLVPPSPPTQTTVKQNLGICMDRTPQPLHVVYVQPPS